MAHPKLGSFDGDVILPVKLFKSKGKVSLNSAPSIMTQ